LILAFLPAVFFGWALGRNDAANIYGTTVTNGLLNYRFAAITASLSIIAGAIIGGRNGLETLASLSSQTLISAAIVAAAAGLSVIILNHFGLPVSSSQAVVGAIMGIGLLNGSVDWFVVAKIVICWITTPLGAALLGYVLYRIIARFFRRIKSIVVQDITLKALAIVIGILGSFALGANNVANITGTFVGSISIDEAALIGGLSIAAGAIIFSKKVMYTVGKRIVSLEAFSAVVAVLAQSLTVLIYAYIGVPVSVSQAIVGAVIGVGLARGSRNFDGRLIRRILLGWLQTPIIAGCVSASLFAIFSFFGLS